MPNSDQPASVDSALDLLLAPSTEGRRSESGPGHPIFRAFRTGLIIFLAVLLVTHVSFWRAPSDFPVGSSVSIAKGATISSASLLLAEKHIVRSPFWFKVWSVLLGEGTGVKAGEYNLSEALPVFSVAHNFTAGIQNLATVNVTVPEGLNNRQIFSVLTKKLTHLNRERFLALAKTKEGYLFPDTYTFVQNATEGEVFAEMEQNFTKRTTELRDRIAVFGKSLHEVITMASLVEGEARTEKTRQEVAGVLWRRLAIGMPLQVDAVFPYILGKNTFEVTTDDLKVDSPYNTYKYAGLPPGPVNNPSLASILATITPTDGKYLYYLSDKDGQMHYAVTHEEHLKNRAKYLGK